MKSAHIKPEGNGPGVGGPSASQGHQAEMGRDSWGTEAWGWATLPFPRVPSTFPPQPQASTWSHLGPSWEAN